MLRTTTAATDAIMSCGGWGRLPQLTRKTTNTFILHIQFLRKPRASIPHRLQRFLMLTLYVSQRLLISFSLLSHCFVNGPLYIILSLL